MDWKRWVRLLGLVLLVFVLYFAVPVSLTPHRENVLRGIVSVLTLAGLAVGIIWQLRRHLDDSSRRVDGLVVSIVLVIVVFSHAFYVLQRNDPTQFVGLHTRLDSLYFAMTTLTTVGTGDIHAAGQLGRALVLAQMVFNVVFVATAASLLSARVRASVSNRSHPSGRQQPLERGIAEP